MDICRSIEAMRTWRRDAGPVALVPTMGALHQGHLTLVAQARAQLDRQGGGKVVTSIFVNPTQFAPNEDLDKYPRSEARDIDLLTEAGCDALFLPQAGDIWRPGAQTRVQVAPLGRILMGRLRPGHFQGVATVVTKLFNIVQPQIAVFGEKDYQQLTLIRRMVDDLDMPVRIVGVPTVRDADGLALSSRNQRLTPEDRAAAPVLAHALDQAAASVHMGTPVSLLRRQIRTLIAAEPRAEIRSIDIRNADDLSRIAVVTGPVAILLAVRFGDVLLIDQRTAHP